METWPPERSRHGGFDPVPVEPAPGRLWLCGKHFVAPDPIVALARTHTDLVVCLCRPGELESRYPDYAQWLRDEEGNRAWWRPVPDLHVPERADATALVDGLCAELEAGKGVLLHCGAGIGRAGTVAAAVLLALGRSLDTALATVAASRPMAGPEAGPQADLLADLARHYGGTPQPGRGETG